MELILISCSAKKTEGGTSEYHPSHLVQFLSDHSFQDLLSLRLTISQFKGQPAGPDLGGKVAPITLQYKPAYLRYSGNIFQRSNFAELFPKAQNKKVLIVSALYGILDANDDIQKYNASMTDTLPVGTRLYTWWKQNGLGEILYEYVQKLKPEKIHDLLPENYRKALAPWPTKEFGKSNMPYIAYNDLGPGNSSQWNRGDKLRELLISD